MMGNSNLWNRSRKALVVLNNATVDEIAQYHKAISAAGKEIDNWLLMVATEIKKENEELNIEDKVIFISEKGFNIFGKITDELARTAFQNSYDIVIVIGDLPKRILKKVRKSNHGMSVGLNCTLSIWDINLKAKDATPGHLINFVKQTLEKIE